MIFGEGTADALTWTVVVASVISLIGNIWQLTVNARVKLAETRNSLEIALLKKELEYKEKELEETRRELAELKGHR